MTNYNEIRDLSKLPYEFVKITTTYAGRTKDAVDMILKSIWYQWWKIDFWRKWWKILELKDNQKIVLIQAKWPESTDVFGAISDFVITWTDIRQKIYNNTPLTDLRIIKSYSSEIIWWEKTFLWLLIPRWLLDNDDFDLDKDFFGTIITKFIPILTGKALKKNGLTPELLYVDSNSEIWAQVMKILWKEEIGIVEIVQSWKSVLATDNYIIKIFGKWEIWVFEVVDKEFKWKSWLEEGKYRLLKTLERNSPIWKFVWDIFMEICLDVCENMSFDVQWERKENKERIKKLLEVTL